MPPNTLCCFFSEKSPLVLQINKVQVPEKFSEGLKIRLGIKMASRPSGRTLRKKHP